MKIEKGQCYCCGCWILKQCPTCKCSFAPTVAYRQGFIQMPNNHLICIALCNCDANFLEYASEIESPAQLKMLEEIIENLHEGGECLNIDLTKEKPIRYISWEDHYGSEKQAPWTQSTLS